MLSTSDPEQSVVTKKENEMLEQNSESVPEIDLQPPVDFQGPDWARMLHATVKRS
jgi:hypothetical protein